MRRVIRAQCGQWVGHAEADLPVATQCSPLSKTQRAEPPSNRRGDECDPDPCAAWNYSRSGKVLKPSLRFVGMGEVEVGETANLSFESFGGELAAEELDVPGADHYASGETFEDVRVAYCSCAGPADCESCPRDGITNFPGNPVTGEGWFAIQRKLDGDTTEESKAV